MHVAVTGSSGLLGTALRAALTHDGHRVTRLVRRPPSAPDELAWSPAEGRVPTAALRDVDAVVHLAGEGIASRRWTAEQKRRIRESRTRGTRVLAEALAAADAGPRVLVCASAIGWYGDRGDEPLTEDSAPGTGFLAEVCQAWEAAADPAHAAGLRVVHLRIGIVQTPKGGALGRQLPVFRLAGAARLGSGRQYVSWVSLDDVVGVALFALSRDDVAGAVNVTAPNPVTNAEYTATLARALRRPVLPLGVPPVAPGLLLGRELAPELLYSSARVLPARALAEGYDIVDPLLVPALRRLLART